MKNPIALSKKILLLCLLSIFLLTCKKDDSDLVCTDANTIKPAKDAIDYFYFKKGTWWLYKEDSTMITDSIWISRDSIYPENYTSLKQHCGCGTGKCSNHYLITFSNRIHNPSTGKPLNGIGIVTSFSSGEGDVLEGSDYCYLGSGIRIAYKTDKYRTPTDQGAILENIDSIKVSSHVFKDIIHQYYPSQNNIPDWLHEAWYARNMYLVKYRKYDGTNWSLINYHIVK